MPQCHLMVSCTVPNGMIMCPSENSGVPLIKRKTERMNLSRQRAVSDTEMRIRSDFGHAKFEMRISYLVDILYKKLKEG